MTLQSPLRLHIGDAFAVVTGLSPALAARFDDLLRPFIVASANAPTANDAPEGVSIAVNEIEEMEGDQPGVRWVVLLRGDELCSHTDADELLKYLEWLAVAESLVATRRYAVFHGAALTNGAATALLVGPSGAGKSTLTLHLLQRGWRPLGDDMTLMEFESGLVYPFPRCFHVDPAWSDQASSPDFEWPAGLSGFARPLQWASGGHSITAIFLIERDPTGASTCLPIPQAQAAGALLTQAIKTQLAPAQIAQAAVRLAAGARCYQLTNGDLQGALDLITASSRSPLAHSSLK